MKIGKNLSFKERFDFYRQLLIFRKLLVRTENDDYILQKGMT
ncbi:hypothetical protein [Anoxybacter fermentans]|nr:hypothetical protein [Anoxybacter fermentans]